MAWTVGDQKPRKNTLISNKQILEKKGFLDEREAKLLFYQFLRNNVTFATSLLMGVELFPFQHIMINSMLKSDYSLCVCGRGLSKSFSAGICAGLDAIFNQGINIGILSSSYRQCLEENEFVLLDNGLKRIKDVSVGDKIFAKEGLQEVKNKWFNEPSKGIQVETRRGYGLSGKLEHKVLTYNPITVEFEYKELKDLALGDCLPISVNEKSNGKKLLHDINLPKQGTGRKQNKFIKPEDSEEFYYLLGQLVGDGYFVEYYRPKSNSYSPDIGLSTADDETLNYCRDYLQTILPENTLKIRQEEDSLCKTMRISSVALSSVIKQFGYEPNTDCINKQIPHKIFSAKKEFQAAFIRGLMDSDGTASTEKSNGRVRVIFATSSINLAKQFKLLLLTFGITTGMTKSPAKNEVWIRGKQTKSKESYRIDIIGHENLKRYYKKIGFKLSRKQNILQKYIENQKPKHEWIGVPGLRQYLLKYNKFLSKKEKAFLGFDDCKSVEKSKLAFLLEKPFVEDGDKEKLRYLVNCDLFFDTIKEIKDVESIRTVDIEVENEHCYWGNGFINHNSKMIFRKLEEVAAKPEAYLFRQAITNVRHGSDEWQFELGRSKITALPLGDGEKLRGYRFNRIYIDEFLLMPERVITEILSPFLAVVQEPQKRKEIYDFESKLIARGEMKEEDRHQFESNKLIALSSASYKFEYLYKLYQQYENLILYPKSDNNAKRCIIQLSYDCAPDHLYDKNQVDQAKATMSDAQFSREYGAQFSDDSAGFFKVSKMALCTIPEGESPCVEVQGEPSCEYLVSVDPSWAESADSDDFAISVFKIDNEKKITTLIHAYALPGTALKEHIKYFHYLLTNFNIAAICGDYNGFLQFLSACNQSELFKSTNIELKCIDVEFENPVDYNANLIASKAQYNKSNHKYVFMRKPTSQWIRNANELLQANFDHRRIYFASRATDGAFHTQANKRIDILNLTYKTKTLEEIDCDNVSWSEEGAKRMSSMIDFLDHIHEMIQLTKVQCAMIVPTTSVQGTQSFDLPKNLRGSGKNKVRKDSYSALVLGNWISKIYFDMQSINVEETDSTFTPMMI